MTFYRQHLLTKVLSIYSLERQCFLQKVLSTYPHIDITSIFKRSLCMVKKRFLQKVFSINPLVDNELYFIRQHFLKQDLSIGSIIFYNLFNFSFNVLRFYNFRKNDQNLLSQIHKSNHNHLVMFQQTTRRQHLSSFKMTNIVE